MRKEGRPEYAAADYRPSRRRLEGGRSGVSIVGTKSYPEYSYISLQIVFNRFPGFRDPISCSPKVVFFPSKSSPRLSSPLPELPRPFACKSIRHFLPIGCRGRAGRTMDSVDSDSLPIEFGGTWHLFFLDKAFADVCCRLDPSSNGLFPVCLLSV